MTSHRVPTVKRKQPLNNGLSQCVFKRKRDSPEKMQDDHTATCIVVNNDMCTSALCQDTEEQDTQLSGLGPAISCSADSQPPQKRTKTVETMAVTQRASAADPTWTKDFPWVFIRPGALYCSWCIKYNRTYTTNGGVWTKKPCKQIRRGATWTTAKLAHTRMQL